MSNKANKIHTLDLVIDVPFVSDVLEQYTYYRNFFRELGLRPVMIGGKVLVPVIKTIDIDCFFAAFSNIAFPGLLGGQRAQHFFITDTKPVNLEEGSSGLFDQPPVPRETLWSESDNVTWSISDPEPGYIPPYKTSFFATDLNIRCPTHCWFGWEVSQVKTGIFDPQDTSGYPSPYGRIEVSFQYSWDEIGIREWVAENTSKSINK